MKPDEMNEKVGVLNRREIEARVLQPLIEAFAERFGRDETTKIVSDVIRALARESGRSMRAHDGDDSLETFAADWEPWFRGGSLEIQEIERTADRWDFDVTRCRYAELYRELGLTELGATLSCNRDAALVEGFSDNISLERAQTIMQGAPCCTFRYRRHPD